jgi:hypothetical protein
MVQFKRKIADLCNNQAASLPSSALCDACRPVGHLLRRVGESQNRSITGGTTNAIRIGDLDHAFSQDDCPLCALVVRLTVRLEQQTFYELFGARALDRNDVRDIPKAVVKISYDAGPPPDLAESYYESEWLRSVYDYDGWIAEQKKVRISINSIRNTGSISV